VNGTTEGNVDVYSHDIYPLGSRNCISYAEKDADGI
jgi:hypothetical protein